MVEVEPFRCAGGRRPRGCEGRQQRQAHLTRRLPYLRARTPTSTSTASQVANSSVMASSQSVHTAIGNVGLGRAILAAAIPRVILDSGAAAEELSGSRPVAADTVTHYDSRDLWAVPPKRLSDGAWVNFEVVLSGGAGSPTGEQASRSDMT